MTLKSNSGEKRGSQASFAPRFVVFCTRSGQSVVDWLHIAEIKVDTNGLFVLTLNAEGVETQSFFDAVLRFIRFVRRVRGASKIALRHRKMKGREGSGRASQQSTNRGESDPLSKAS